MYATGYQGLIIDDLLGLIQPEPIDCLVDVRLTPISRKPHFSKTALRSVLQNHHVDYVHLPELGSPQPLRQALQASGDWGAFAAGYNAWTAHQTPALEALEFIMSRSTVVLLCFEADPGVCHRSLLVAKLVERSGGEVQC